MISDFFLLGKTPFLIIIAYLIGSIPFAVIISKFMKLKDPRIHGSKNPGATNVFRIGSRTAAFLTLFSDILKGWIPFYFCNLLNQVLPNETFSAIAFAVYFGHIHPIFLKFRGGKGVATLVGILFAIHTWLAFATILTWLATFFLFRYSSLSSLFCAFLIPVYYMLGIGIGCENQKPIIGTLILISLLILYRHRENINRLIRGKENRIIFREKKSARILTID